MNDEMKERIEKRRKALYLAVKQERPDLYEKENRVTGRKGGDEVAGRCRKKTRHGGSSQGREPLVCRATRQAAAGEGAHCPRKKAGRSDEAAWRLI